MPRQNVLQQQVLRRADSSAEGTLHSTRVRHWSLTWRLMRDSRVTIMAGRVVLKHNNI